MALDATAPVLQAASNRGHLDELGRRHGVGARRRALELVRRAASAAGHARAQSPEIAQFAAGIDDGAAERGEPFADEIRRRRNPPRAGLAAEAEQPVEIGDAEAEQRHAAVGADDLDAAAAGIDDVAIAAPAEGRADQRRLGLLAQRLVAPAHRPAGVGDRSLDARIAAGGCGSDHVDGRNRRQALGQVRQQLADARRVAGVVDRVPGARGPEGHRPVGSLMKLDAPAAAVDDELCAHRSDRMVQ